MRVNALPGLHCQIACTRSKDVQGSRRLTALDRIHYDERLKPFQKPQHKVHASDTDVHGINMRG
jgi:hypothetical protein